jgi:glycerophosphoryl diester phosphodiesterase
MLIIAHRGHSAACPENTLEAFEAAIAAGADFIETDPRLTRDGVVVCFHDPTLQRRAGRPEAIADMDFAALRAIALEDGGRIFALEEVLDLARGRIPVVLDVKVPGTAMQERIAFVVERTGMRDHIVQGVRTLDDCRALAGRHACRDILAFLADYDEIDRFAAAGASFVRLWEEDVTPERLAAIRRGGCRPWVTCGLRGRGEVGGHCEPERLVRLAGLGVDGVILNDPAMARTATTGTGRVA